MQAAEEEALKAVAALGCVLQHPMRVRILMCLADGPQSAKGLSEQLDEPLASVSYHFNAILDRKFHVLELVERRPVRGTEAKVYRLDVDAFAGLARWPLIAAPAAAALRAAGLGAFWEKVMEAVDGGALDRSTTLASWRPVTVDEAGWRQIRAAMQEAEARIATAVEASQSRGSKEVLNGLVGFAAFEAGGDRRGRTVG